jgi:hypothetical protein
MPWITVLVLNLRSLAQRFAACLQRIANQYVFSFVERNFTWAPRNVAASASKQH